MATVDKIAQPMGNLGFGRGRTAASRISAFGGKADMAFCGFYFLICASADRPSEFGQGFL
jgi:hypothetical protein